MSQLKVPLLQTSNESGSLPEPPLKHRRQSKYKPPESMAVALSKGLEFAPLARVLVNSNIIYIFGFVAIIMEQDRSSSLAFTTAPGVYCIVLAIFIYIWHFVSEFTKQDKSVDSVLHPRGWPQVVCLILSTFNLNPVQCVFCLITSVYTFFCVQTAICGFPMILGAIFYLVASIRKEESLKITGIV